MNNMSAPHRLFRSAPSPTNTLSYLKWLQKVGPNKS